MIKYFTKHLGSNLHDNCLFLKAAEILTVILDITSPLLCLQNVRRGNLKYYADIQN